MKFFNTNQQILDLDAFSSFRISRVTLDGTRLKSGSYEFQAIYKNQPEVIVPPKIVEKTGDDTKPAAKPAEKQAVAPTLHGEIFYAGNKAQCEEFKRLFVAFLSGESAVLNQTWVESQVPD